MPRARQPFSERHGHIQVKQIIYRDDLPAKCRSPIFTILKRYANSILWERIQYMFGDPYAALSPSQPIPASQASHYDLIEAQRFLQRCPWFQVYDVIEDIFKQLDFYEEIRSDPDEELRAYPFQDEINAYFMHTGIGWQLLNGEIVTRSDEAFEGTVKTAVAVLEQARKPTAAGHLRFAITALSARPKANTSGAVAQATNAVECVLGQITGQALTLGAYLDKHRSLFHPALKKGLDGIYGYASDQGARHGKEGTEPTIEEAEFVVAACAAVCNLLTRKPPK
jgi:hypothetical protein